MNKTKTLLAFVILILATALSVFLGSAQFSKTIFLSLRLPRILLAIIAGSLLASSGACFQMYFRNPLAEPGIMGISSGAALGAVIAQTTGLSTFAFTFINPLNIFSFAGALLSGAVLAAISQKKSAGSSSAILLLCGSATGTFYASVSSILLMKSRQLNGIFSWLLGSFNGRGWAELKFIAIPSIAAFILLGIASRKLDLLNGGEKTALSLGLETSKLRTIILIAGALAVSSAVCAGGTISFVGLIAPHIVRKLYGSKARTLIFTSAIYGASLVLLSDLIARTVTAPSELPAGVITSLLGAPFFISLIFNGSSKGGMQ